MCKSHDNIPKIISKEKVIIESKKVYVYKEREECFLGEIIDTIKDLQTTFLYNEEFDIGYEVEEETSKTIYKTLDKEKLEVLKDKMVDKGTHYEIIL